MRPAWLLVVGLAAVTGCKSLDGPRSAEPSSRAKDKPPPAEDRWPDETTPPWVKGAVPAAGSWGDPRDPKFDHANAGKGLLAGYVEDADGRKAKDVALTIALADPKGSKDQPIVTLADRDGAFLVPNLKPGETYLLTAQMRDGTRLLVGQTYATAPSVHVRVRLKEDNAAGGGGPGLPTPAPLADGTIAAPPLPGSSDTAWSPTAAPLKTLAPAGPAANVAPPLPAAEALPAPAVAPTRPDLTTGTPQPDWRPPAVAVPGPTTVAPPPLPSFGPAPPAGRTGANKPAIQNRFTLVDPLGRDREFPTQQPGTYVLLDFMTTTCIPCMRATPKLVEFQKQFGGKGVEVVAVACDTLSPGDRRAAAADYAKKHGVKNYLLYTEPGLNPGAVQKQFRVDGYPTLVLLDAWGTVLWTGHPNDLNEAAKALSAR
jgi:thiol-disulfide isomerase/thioredoxin